MPLTPKNLKNLKYAFTSFFPEQLQPLSPPANAITAAPMDFGRLLCRGLNHHNI
jgi:hypothetical protein